LEAAYQPWPAPQRSSIATNAIIPAGTRDDVVENVRHAVDVLGCTTIKLKVGDEHDAERLAIVRSLLPPAGRIRLDVNAGWTVAQTIEFWHAHGDTDIDYLEQPVRTYEELQELRSQVDCRIALDESIRWDPTQATANFAEVADVAIIKVAPIGGIRAAIDTAERIGLPVVVSGSMDSSIGLAHAVACASVMPHLAGPCGFGTGVLLADDLLRPSLIPQGGIVPVTPAAPDLDLLAQARARVSDAERERLMVQLEQAWWSGPAEIWSEHIRQDA
jgi:O-succinylbenzoate synthase